MISLAKNVASNVELGRIWKESVLSSFQVLLLSGGTEEMSTHFGKKSSDKASSPSSGHTHKDTCSSTYLKLQVIQSKCIRVISNHPRRTPTSHLHNSVNMEPIPLSSTALLTSFSLTAPYTPAPYPTNRELYSSRRD